MWALSRAARSGVRQVGVLARVGRRGLGQLCPWFVWIAAVWGRALSSRRGRGGVGSRGGIPAFFSAASRVISPLSSPPSTSVTFAPTGRAARAACLCAPSRLILAWSAVHARCRSAPRCAGPRCALGLASARLGAGACGALAPWRASARARRRARVFFAFYVAAQGCARAPPAPPGVVSCGPRRSSLRVSLWCCKR